jgi:hypothetical protein
MLLIFATILRFGPVLFSIALLMHMGIWSCNGTFMTLYKDPTLVRSPSLYQSGTTTVFLRVCSSWAKEYWTQAQAPLLVWVVIWVSPIILFAILIWIGVY